MTVNSKRIYLGKISFRSPRVIHSSLLWFGMKQVYGTIDISVSTCVEVVLFAVELQNMKVRNLQYYILNSAQNIGLRNASSVLP